MNLAIFSHKPCARLPDGEVVTHGGFPFQMRAIAELFAQSSLCVPCREVARVPEGATRLRARGLRVVPLTPLPDRGLARRLGWFRLMLRHGFRIWQEIGHADAVHTPIPSDVGLVALLLGLLRRKRLFVRHCGTWGAERSLADRFLKFLLPRIAGGRVVVLATGGGSHPPVPTVPEIGWIFATTLSQEELEVLDAAPAWRPGTPPQLISVGRLDRSKNVAASIAALARIRPVHPQATLTILGDGPERRRLEDFADTLGVGDAILFLGNVSHEDVLTHLGRAHLLLFPTRVAEGFPKAALEALACGVPVLAPAVSVLPELIQDAGNILPDTSGETLGRMILELLADPDGLAGKAREARRRARRYTLESWQARIAEALTRQWTAAAIRTELQDERS